MGLGHCIDNHVYRRIMDSVVESAGVERGRFAAANARYFYGWSGHLVPVVHHFAACDIRNGLLLEKPKDTAALTLEQVPHLNKRPLLDFHKLQKLESILTGQINNVGMIEFSRDYNYFLD